MLLPLGLVTAAEAQSTPGYVVSSQIQINPTAGINGARANYAVNSRGDFFFNDGHGHVIEYPSGGGAFITLWTDANSYGPSGVAVDPFDNLYVTNFYGDGGYNDTDSQVYEFPSTNGSYPSPYIYNAGAPPRSCNPYEPVSPTNPTAIPANTGVCAVGQYAAASSFYWQPLGIAADGQGNTYMFSNYDNTYNSTSHGIFKCNALCNEQQLGGSATAYTTKLSTTITSMIADYAGDLYLTDTTGVYIIPAGSPPSKNTPVAFDTSYNTPYGVTLDQSGNMYVTDATGIWETPSLETTGDAPCKGPTDSCKLTPSAKYKIVLLTTFPTPPYSGAEDYYLSAAVDNRGNILYAIPGSSGSVVMASLWAGKFPSAQVGSTGSTAAQFTILFNQTTTLSSLTAIQGSRPATEFAVSPGTCTTGIAFAVNSTCTFTATFTPSGLGIRSGAVVIADTGGTTTTSYLSGVGTGTGLTVDPGTPIQIGGTFKQAAGVAVDGMGNVYVADSTANTVMEFILGGGSGISIGTGLSVPTGVAVDGAGDVLIVNQGVGNTSSAGTGFIVEVPMVDGALKSSAQTTLVSGLNMPTGVVLDGGGNIYVSLSGSNSVVQMANATRNAGSGALVARGYGLNAPTGLTVDTAGNIYVADTGNNRVMELGDGFQNTVGSGLTAPTGVAVDPSGSVIIADGTGRLIRVPNEIFGANAAGLNQADQQVLSSPLSYPYGLSSDNLGNLYVSDNVANVVYELQRTTGQINFGNWNLNTVSDAQSIILSNIGTSVVTLGNPLFVTPPTASEFTASIGTDSTACGSGAFHSGYNCSLSASFTPKVLGPANYLLTFNIAGLNNAPPTVNLVGQSASEDAGTLTLTQTSPTGTISYGQQIIITAVVAAAANAPGPTGLLIFTFDGQNQRPIALTSTGSASITLNNVNAGTHSVSAYYEGDTNYASLTSASLPLNIQLATSTNVLTIVGDSADPLSVAPTHPIAMTDVLTPGIVGLFTGTVSFVDTSTSPATVLSVVKLGSPNPTTGTYTSYFNYAAPSGSTGFTLGSHTIIAEYSGNSNYVANNSETVSYVVSPATYTVTANTTNVVASVGNPGVINLVVTDYSNYQGGVSLSCSGLPANAYCVFLPGSAQLVPGTLITPNTIYPIPVTLQVMVDQSSAVVNGSMGWFGAISISLLLFWKLRSKNKGLAPMSLVALLCLAGISSLSGCGGGSVAFPTPAGTYPVVITATSTPLVSGNEPPCSYTNCNLPPGPTNPSINVVQTINVTLTVK